MDTAIHWRDHYSVDNVICFVYTYPLDIENTTWAHGDMKFIFACSTQYPLTREISRLNTRRSISYLQAPMMYYSIYYINLAQFFQKVDIPKVISGHMCLIRYQNTCVLIRHFSVAKIPIVHCSLYNKAIYPADRLQLSTPQRTRSRKISPQSNNKSVQIYSDTLHFKHQKSNNTTLQVKTILVAMATKLEQQSLAWRLKLRRRIESVSLIQ